MSLLWIIFHCTITFIVFTSIIIVVMAIIIFFVVFLVVNTFVFRIIGIGVRESASAERIKDAHRRIMQINHPDKGGSAYMQQRSMKLNSFCLKGSDDDDY